MGDLEVIKAIGTFVSGTGAVGILVFVLYRIESGKWKTKEHHDEVVADKDKDAARAWEMVQKMTDARTQDNVVMERLAENISDIKGAVDALRSSIDNQRARR